MGNSTPTEKIDHPRLGNVAIVELDGKKYIQYVISVHHEQAQRDWEDVLKDIRGKREFEGMFLPLSFQVQKVPCGISRNLKALYPYFPYSLASEIQNRVHQDAPFEEKELQYLLFELVDLAKEFEKVGKKAGNFKPDNILINQDGEVSFLCQHSYPGFTDGYTAALYDNEPSYLAPEEMRHLETKDEEPAGDPGKAQAFSIGMTVMATGLLQDLLPAYNFKSAKFNDKKFQDYLTEWRKHPKYTVFFKDIVEKMLRHNPAERFTSSEMRAYLSPYEPAIKTLQNYEPNIPLSEQNLLQYRQSKINKKRSNQEQQQHKGIRHLGAKFSRNASSRESTNPLDYTAPKPVSTNPSGALNGIDSAKTTRDNSFIKQAQVVSPQQVTNSFYPATFSYSNPYQATQYSYSYQPAHVPTMYTVATLQPTSQISTGIPISTAYETNFAPPSTLPTAPAFVQAPAAVGDTFPTAPEVGKGQVQKQPNTSVQQMLKEFKAELSGQKSEGASPEKDKLPEMGDHYADGK